MLAALEACNESTKNAINSLKSKYPKLLHGKRHGCDENSLTALALACSSGKRLHSQCSATVLPDDRESAKDDATLLASLAKKKKGASMTKLFNAFEQALTFYIFLVLFACSKKVGKCRGN